MASLALETLGLMLAVCVAPAPDATPFPIPTSNKGLQVQMVDDALALGVQRAGINVNLAALVDLEKKPGHPRRVVDRHDFSFNQDYLARLDLQIKPLPDRGVLVDLILLAYPSNNAAVDALVIPPDADQDHRFTVGCFNSQTPAGRAWLEAVPQELAARWSGARPECGRVWGWIVGNAVNSHWRWSNLGPKPLAEAVAEYAQAFRIVHAAVRTASAHARPYASFDHHWASRAAASTENQAAPDRDYLGALAGLTADLDWHVAWHPSPEALGKKVIWELVRAAGTPAWDAAAAAVLPITGLASAAADPTPAPVDRKPNIVVVLFDDLGYGEPGCYRPESKLRMPRLDAFAAEGLRFADAHSASAVCTPTRYGLLTGRYPARIGQYGVLTSFNPPLIPESRLTVASLLKQHGYQTACIGKWHLGLAWQGVAKQEGRVPLGTRITSGPNQLGFDYFYGFTHARNIETIIEQDRVVAHVAAVENQPRMIAKAVEWLEQREADKPFFLYFPMCPPHTPVVPAPEFVGKSGAVDEVGKNPKYGDWVYQGDHMLGQLLDALDRKGLADNTLVIATADNGAAGRPYPPLRGQKTQIHEGGHRVPFVVRWPGKVEPGTVSDQTICLTDLMATCADILSATLPADAGEDSVSILPALLGAAKEPLREATVHQSYSRQLAIRQGPWKLVFAGKGKQEAALYDLSIDIGETRDIAADHPEVVERLTALMRRIIEDGRSTPGAAQPAEVGVTWPVP